MDAEQSHGAYAAHGSVEDMTTTIHDVSPAHAFPAGLTFDVELVAANRRASHGTAWYDIFAVSGDRVVVTVGDRGVDGGAAAFVTRRLRAALTRPAASSGTAADLLRDASAFLHSLPSPGATTALVGVIDLAARQFSYIGASAAPPFICYEDGTVSALPVDLASLEGQKPLASTVVDLHGVARLILSTVGLVRSAEGAEIDTSRLVRLFGDDRLANSLRPAAWLTRGVLADTSHDDAAMLVVTLAATRGARTTSGDSPAWTSSWSFEATPAATHAARRAFLTHLQSKAAHVSTVDFSAAELIFGELLGNVVRHAPGLVEVRLDCTQRVPVLHVLDNGPGFESRRRQERLPDNDLSESGRGLFIISSCAANFNLRNRECGGTHATATLSLNA